MAHLTRVKTRLSLYPHRRVRGLLDGGYAAVQVGRGHDFNDLRAYVRGDDVKDIDWKASARSRQPLVKRYVAERQQQVVLCVSTGRSMAALDPTGVSKRESTVLLAGVLGFLAVRHGDRVGLVRGDAERQHVHPSGGSELHLERLLEAVHSATRPEAAPGDLAALLGFAARTLRRRTMLVVITDEVALSADAARLLRRLAVQHEVMLLGIDDLDPTDPDLTSDLRHLRDVDADTHVPAWLRSDPQLHRAALALAADEAYALRHQLDQLGIAHARVADSEAAIGALLRLLERQRHARRR